MNQSLQLTSTKRSLSITPLRRDDKFLRNPILRSMVSASHSQFKSVQKSLTRDEVLHASHRYRTIVHCHYDKFLDRGNSLEDDNHFGEMLLEIELVWSLCEMLFIQIHTPGSLCVQLTHWIRWHYPITNEIEQLMKLGNNVTQSSAYWDMVKKCIIRGEMNAAVKLIKLDNNWKEQPILSIVVKLMEKMPQLNKDQALYDFFINWSAWSLECNNLFDELKDNLNDNENLRTILGLLSGDSSTIKEMKNLFHSWFHMMVTIILFTDPPIKEIDLASLAGECLEIFKSRNEVKPFDNIIQSAFNLDLMEVFHQSCVAFDDNWWFIAHFIDILLNGDLINGEEIAQPKKLREFFLIDYASSLIEHTSLWALAIDYFTSCPYNGINTVQLYIERLPIDNERKALKLMRIAERLDLNEISKNIATVVSKMWLSKNRLGSALVWAVKSKSPVLTTHIADKFLEYFVEKKEFADEEILRTLGTSMFVSDRLTFLAKYYEFYQLKKGIFLEEAAVQYENLITSKSSPKFFILTLLMDSIPLLEADEIVFNSNQTHQILQSLESYISQPTVKKQLEFNEEICEKIDYLRLAIARNMARALILS